MSPEILERPTEVTEQPESGKKNENQELRELLAELTRRQDAGLVSIENHPEYQESERIRKRIQELTEKRENS